ncbi:oligosaccharide flippase family protein [Flavobacterium sp. 11]|uniref:oligosaccharide flippase family protein n=1 Tax=Flavobacterium sp. 11 TaxID=357523 RepID=UPI000C19EB74|nr:oligosaccharide flippase family protein [Flavobacterium sp. 11]PIF60670.1 PST family polysaccharide transporter [Flavobacterium sp. 11]
MEPSKNRTLLKNIASLGIVQVVNYIFPLITIPYVSRIIGPEGFGVINYITAFVSYFILIINYGFDFTATRKIAVDPDNLEIRSIVFSEVTCARVLLFIVSVAAFLICVSVIPLLSKNLMLSLILFLNVISALLTPQYIFQGLQKLPILSVVTVLKGIINTSLIFLFVSKKDDLQLYASIGVFSNFLISLISILYVIFVIKIKFNFYSIKHSLNILKEVRSVFFSSIIFSLYTTTNIIILGLFQETKTIGYYTTAVSFIIIVQGVVNIPLASSLYPYIGRAFSESQENGINKLRKIVPLVFYFTATVCLGILILAPFVVFLIYGKSFEGSIISVQILSFLPLISAMSSLMGIQTMLNLNMDNLFLKITSFAACFSVVLNLILGYYFSYIGTSISYLFTEVLICISFYIILRNRGLVLFKKDNFKFKNVISQITNIKNI